MFGLQCVLSCLHGMLMGDCCQGQGAGPTLGTWHRDKPSYQPWAKVRFLHQIMGIVGNEFAASQCVKQPTWLIPKSLTSSYTACGGRDPLVKDTGTRMVKCRFEQDQVLGSWVTVQHRCMWPKASQQTPRGSPLF